jgi:hypothetical protein
MRAAMDRQFEWYAAKAGWNIADRSTTYMRAASRADTRDGQATNPPVRTSGYVASARNHVSNARIAPTSTSLR